MLANAGESAQLHFSWQFRSWMLLSILRLTTKKWMELLKEIGHRMPQNAEEYQGVKDILLRERALESSIFDLGTHAQRQRNVRFRRKLPGSGFVGIAKSLRALQASLVLPRLSQCGRSPIP